MDIRFACPHCEQHISIDEAGAGLQIECPNCQAQVTVPEQPPAVPPQRPRIRLGTSQAMLTPPPVLPAPTVPAPAGAVSGDQYHCNNPDCGSILFESELATLEISGKSIKVCPKCRLGVTKLTQEQGFWSKLPRAFAYPFKGNGAWVVVMGTPLLLANDFIGFGIFLVVVKLVLLGLIGAFLVNVVQSTADDEQNPLDWPDVTDKFELITEGLKLLGLGLVVFAPAIVCAVMMITKSGILGSPVHPSGAALLNASPWAFATVACGFLGAVYYPMAFLSFAMFDSLSAVNPVVVVPAILKSLLQYIAILALICGLGTVRAVLNILSTGLPFAWRLGCLLPLELFAFYSLIVAARLLGLLYRANSARFGWFE